MRLIHPEYIYFLLFALVPIILYFFNLQKTIRVDFSNVDMLEDVKRKTSNRFQVKRLLIMLSRVLFVVFAVLAFAQPTFKEERDSGAKHHVLFIDNSLSMTRKVESMVLLDHAKTSLENLLPDSKGHKFSFITNDDQRLSLDFQSKKDFLKEVAKIKSSTYNIDFKQVERAFRRKKTDLPKEYYVLSDFQKTRFGSLDIKSITLDEKDKLNYVNLQAQNDNVYIDSVWMNSKYLVAGNQFSVNFRCLNKSNLQKDVLVKCLIGGRQVGSKVIKLQKGEDLVSDLQLQIPRRGLNSCVLQVEDADVDFDNDYNFVIEANKNINVLVIKSNERSYFQSAYENEPLFVSKSFKESEFNSSELEGIDLIVLESVSQLKNLPIQQLKDFVVKGGYLILVPNKSNTVKTIQQFVSNVGSNARLQMLKSQKENIDFNQVMQDDFYKGVFETTKQKIQGAWFKPQFDMLNGNSLLKSRKGNGLLKSFNVGKGQLFLFSSPFDNDFTDIFRHSLFVPTSYQLAMNSSQTNKNNSFDIAKKELMIEGVNPNSENYYSLVSDKTQYLPDQQVQGKDLLIYLTQNETSGFYDLRSKEENLTRIALNYDRKESDFDPMDLSSLNNIDNIEVMNLDVLKNQTFQPSGESIQLWKWMIVLALLSLLFETSLIRFFK